MSIAIESGLLTTQEAAQFLGVTAGTLEVWRCTRRYPLAWVKVGSKVRYRLCDLQAFVQSRRVTPQKFEAAAMDCEFCSTEPAQPWPVPTVLGQLAYLCTECAAKYGRRRRQNPSTKKGGPAKTARNSVTPVRSDSYDQSQFTRNPSE